MAKSGENSQDVRRGQLLNELFDRHRRGHEAGSSDAAAGDTELAAEISTLARLADDLERGPVTIPGLITRGTLERSADPDCAAKLGPYEIVSLIGAGGMGIVFQAIETRLKRTVALKILRPELVHDRGPLVRFEREARAAAALQHANIVTVHAVGQHIGTPFIAMEYVPGPSLADVIRGSDTPGAPREHGPSCLTPDSIRSIFRQLLEALSAAHDAGLIHRDVKPSNILLVDAPRRRAAGFSLRGAARAEARGSSVMELDKDDTGILESSNPQILPTIKLADFGLARMHNSQTQLTLTQAVLGTPEYMSPEQARGDKDIDRRTDLYSAGVVLYEMLTGQTPFRTDTPTATIHRILYEEPRIPRKLDKATDPVLASVALRLMAKSAEDRFASAGEVIEALAADKHVKSLVRARHARRRRRRIGIATAAVALVAVAASFVPWRELWRGPIVEARVINDAPHVVEVRYGDDRTWRSLLDCREFNPPLTCSVATAVALDDQTLVAIGVIPEGGRNDVRVKSLQAFYPDRTVAWAIEMNREWPARLTWPDCPDTPRARWSVRCLQAMNVDGIDGEEFVVVAKDPAEYPTRVSTVDPRNGDIRSTFWHQGELTEIAVIDDYFGPGRPAILVTGVNNKLGGFNEHLPGDPGPPLADGWDKVAVAMILDPRNLNGLSPPYTERVSIAGRPWAYAFLDISTAITTGQVDGNTRFAIHASETAMLSRPVVSVTADSAGDRGVREFQFSVASESGTSRGSLVLGAGLEFKRWEPSDEELRFTTQQDWNNRWHPIVQNGQLNEDEIELLKRRGMKQTPSAPPDNGRGT